MMTTILFAILLFLSISPGFGKDITPEMRVIIIHISQMEHCEPNNKIIYTFDSNIEHPIVYCKRWQPETCSRDLFFQVEMEPAKSYFRIVTFVTV